MDALSYKRRALGHFPLDNWGGSSSNGDSSSTSVSGYGEGSTGGGYHSLAGITGFSSSSSGTSYQEEQQPPDNPAPVVAAPAPDPAPLEAVLAAEKPAAPEAALSLAGSAAASKNDSIGYRLLGGMLGGPVGIVTTFLKALADGSLSSLKANAPAWTKDADFNATRYTNNASSSSPVYGSYSLPAVNTSPVGVARQTVTKNPIVYDSSGYPLVTGWDYQPGQLIQLGTPQTYGGSQSNSTSSNDGMGLAVVAVLALLAFS